MKRGIVLFKHWLGIVAAWSALLGACATGSGIDLGSTEQPIINGQIDDDRAHDAIVALTDADGYPFCTGTYVGNATIVTAAHCFDDDEPAFIYFGVNALGDNEACLGGDEFACSAFTEVVAHEVFPTYMKENLEQGGDIAVIDIGGEPEGIEPIPMLSSRDGTQLTASDDGAPIVFVGFGVTDGVTQTGSGIRRNVGSKVGVVGPRTVPMPDGDITLTADQVFVRQENGGTCQGDSGGPMLIKRDGVEHLVGVTSFGDDGCFAYGVSVLVQAHRSFVREFQGLPPDEDPDEDPGETDGDEGGCRIAGNGGTTGPLIVVVLSVGWALRKRKHRRDFIVGK